MSDEIQRYGVGERGVFKLERPKLEGPSRNLEIATREAERGCWWVNPETKQIEEFIPKAKPVAHMIQTDTIDPVESLATLPHERKFVTDSRSALDRHYRERGYERCSKKDLQREAPKKEFDPEEHQRHWEQAGNDVKYGEAPLSEWEKEVCRREQRYLEERAKGSRSDLMEQRLAEEQLTTQVRR